MNLFDEVIDRRRTESYKWDGNNDPEDMISMPVADMDFRCPDPVLEALREVTNHGVMGYSIVPEELKDLFQARLMEYYGWETRKEWQVWVPGLIPAISSIAGMIGSSGDEILTTLPAYYPIHLAPGRAGRRLKTIPLRLVSGRWTIDFDELQNAISSRTRLFILCNPHNPAGTVFRREELLQLANICQKHGVVICSDEIHCDLILDVKQRHIPVASISQAAADLSITLMAPSKTFNIAGLGCSVAIISNDSLRAAFEERKSAFFPFLSRYAIRAAIAAYQYGELWRKELIAYLKSNHDFLLRRINKLEGLRMYPLEATYLGWVQSSFEDVPELLQPNGVRVLDGRTFLTEGFFRINFACPRSVLEQAVERIEKTMSQIYARSLPC